MTLAIGIDGAASSLEVGDAPRAMTKRVSAFSCPVVRIQRIEPIAGADEIETARVLGCEVIVPKRRYTAGDVAVYVPPGALLPERLAAGLKGAVKLFGERRTRTRAYRLRGAFSEGILIGPLRGAAIGSDAAGMLGITRYEPPIPRAWRGEAVRVPGLTVPYDIRSARRCPGALRAGEAIELTEKLHGTFCAVGHFPGLNRQELPDNTIIYSKGLGITGHVFRKDTENIYTSIAAKYMLPEAVRAAFNNRPATVFGEIYGAGVQDLHYGTDEALFALFDIYLGLPGRGRWLNREEMDHISGEIAPSVPVIFRGELDDDVVRRTASGATVAGRGRHLSEGVVIRPLIERNVPRIGRAVFKYVSPEYLTRKNGTEYE